MISQFVADKLFGESGCGKTLILVELLATNLSRFRVIYCQLQTLIKGKICIS